MRLFGNWRTKHMEPGHEAVSGAKLLVSRDKIFSLKVSKASETKIIVIYIFSKI